MTIETIILLILSYLIGAIPFSFIIARQLRGVDLRYVGEGNVGARNVWHIVGKKWGIIAALLDASKGLLVFFVAHWLSSSLIITWLAGVCVIMGHDFPIFLKGLGGKGAASAVGFLLGMYPFPILCSSMIMLALYVITKDFHIAVSIGMASLILLWLPLFGAQWQEMIIASGFLLILGIKRIIDEPHMRRIRQQSGWED
ncbi:MAG: glycerol-3-phosphate acyltransferase [bacterium]|nr:MAG: glycerol-3-phosphate acyltransferase [bacterium]